MNTENTILNDLILTGAIVVPDESVFSAKIEALRRGGHSNLHIVADFDKTLTKATVNGSKTTTTWDIFNTSPEYKAEHKRLLDIYQPVEHDPSIPIEAKKEKMDEWWEAHLKLLVDEKLSLRIIEESLQKGGIELRSGFDDLMGLMDESSLPFLVFSAGLGDVIEKHLEMKEIKSPNIHIISNYFIFNEEGCVTGFKDKIVQIFTKTEEQIRKSPHMAGIIARKNVVLLGDSSGDVGMVDGMDHDTVLKIGFLNGLTANLEAFKKAFDVVVIEDSGLEPVIRILKEIK